MRVIRTSERNTGMRTIPRSIAGAALLGLLTLAGCGSDDNGDKAAEESTASGAPSGCLLYTSDAADE